MAPLKDDQIRRQLQRALEMRRFSSQAVTWKATAAEWVLANLEQHRLIDIERLLEEHIGAGGVIDQVVERRPEYRDQRPFHYDFRFTLENRLIYIETCLDDDDPDFPLLRIVSVHDA